MSVIMSLKGGAEVEFKDLLKHRRLDIGLTLEDVGKKVGVSKATVLRWESGEIKNLRRDKIAKLADALQTTPAYLMGWDEVEKPTELPKKVNLSNMTKAEQAHMEIYRKLNKTGRRKADDYIQDLSEQSKYTNPNIISRKDDTEPILFAARGKNMTPEEEKEALRGIKLFLENTTEED